MCGHFRLHTSECRVAREGSKQLIVARAGFVNAREDRVDHLQPRRGSETLIRHTGSRMYTTIAAGRMFERTNDRCPDRHDPPIVETCAIDCESSRCGNVVGLIERQAGVERLITRRRNACGVRQRDEFDLPPSHRAHRLPVQYKAC